MKIVVLAGGTSTERTVSLISGKKIFEALKQNGHQVVLLDVYLGYDGDDYEQVFESDRDWTGGIEQIGEKAPDLEAVKKLRKDDARVFFGPHVLEICSMADIVFMGLHGANGEDGRVQAVFDLFGIKYTGSNYRGAAISMDKGVSKGLFGKHGIPTPQGFILHKGQEITGKIEYPAVVKTCCGGSSVGVYIVENEEALGEALIQAFTYEDEVVIEQYIKGREFSVGVIDGKALPVIEIAPIQGFYDYKNKYQAGSTVETCPADIPQELSTQMQKYAEAAFEALHLSSYARMDFMMRENGEMFCLEANTLPGMTPTSLLPQEAAAIGMDFNRLCEKLIEVSLKS
ncbi:MAG: D-alanine--D-alanine ligase [Lachnospiraceae bacterium]|jgi:D-alanine-D-alanine ligase|nr:D-alanine--D-alanine ligase [Lachnospiraceae bacterium]